MMFHWNVIKIESFHWNFSNFWWSTEFQSIIKKEGWNFNQGGGLWHITCSHGITLGFTALKNGESPSLFTNVLIKRMPPRVKAKSRFFIYDNRLIQICLSWFVFCMAKTIITTNNCFHCYSLCHPGIHSDKYTVNKCELTFPF